MAILPLPGPGAVMTTSYTAGQRLDGEWTSNIDTDVGKKYIRITGGAAFGSIVMDVQGQHIDTASTVFSVPYNFDVTLVDGSYSIPTKVRFLPGSGLYVYNDARLTVDGTLIAYNGLYDKVFRDKYYPTTKILGDYDFSKIADLVVDGTMEVKGTFAGLVQSMAAGAVVSIDGKAKVSLSKQPYGTSGSFSGKSMDNLSRMDLRAFAMDAYGNEVAMLAGKTYTSTDAAAHTLASYSCYSPVDGKLTVVELGQAVKGSWSTGAYGVTYSANGGTGSVPVDPMRYDAGEYATVMGQGSLAKEQNKFAGWSTSASGGAVYKAGQKILVNSDITLYAVWEPSISVTGVSLDKAKASIEEGGTVTLKATVAPSDAAVKTVSWSSSSSKVATVSNGKVTGVSPGTATITVTTVDGGFKATCEVTVTKAVVPVTGVDISLSSIVLKEGASRTLAAAVLPANATDRSVEWSSADPSVATVSNGKVTAVSVGQTVITVTTVDGGFIDTCSVKVESAAVSVTGVDLTLTEARMTPGGSMALAYEVLPANATNKAVAWSSSNPDVADVAGGMVTAKSLGTATITITTADGGLTDKCIVTVVSSTVNVTGVTLNKAQASIVEGGSDILVATIAPANATNRAVEWATSDAAVATVDAFGNVTAVAPGTAKITVTTKDGGYVASCTVEVTKAAVPVTGVSLDVESKELVEGDSFDLHATVLPADADDASVVWTTSDKDVASVADGRVTAVSAGSAVIRVTTADGGFVDECAVTVTAKAIPAAGVTLDRQSAEIEAGGTVTLVATVSPADASEKGVSWITSNANVAMVKDGIVTGVSEGEATITVETADGGFTATCAVKVTAPVVHATGVQLDFHSLSLTIGDLSVLKETVSPHEAQDKEVRWSSSDSKIVTVSGGSVRAISAGTATVTVTTVDGGYTDSCTVTVAEPPAPSGDNTLLYVGIGVAAIIAVLAAALLIKRRGA